jgi:hypothetical protein
VTEFLLGAPAPNWAWNGLAKGSLFVSATRLRSRRSRFPRAQLPEGARVCMDSGGFTATGADTRFVETPAQYADLVRRVADGLDCLGWAAVQDWMVADSATQPTGLPIVEHQRRTTESLLDLRSIAPDVHWVPVLQGRTLADYLEHVEAHARAGVDLRAEPIVGVGSICKRHRSEGTGVILRALHRLGLRLHGFGVKTEGLARYACWLASADSMAWSWEGRQIDRKRYRKGEPEEGLANSQAFAEAWRTKMLEAIERPVVHQLAMEVA